MQAELFLLFLKKLYFIYAHDSSIKKKKQCFSQHARSARFMINGVKKLEFIFKTLVAHTETINPIYWAPTIHQTKNPKNQHKISERSNNYYKTLILLCVSLLKKKKKGEKKFPIYHEIFWV